jgi:hypothetical protein
VRGTFGSQTEKVTGNWRESKEKFRKISVLTASLLKIQDFLGCDSLCILNFEGLDYLHLQVKPAHSPPPPPPNKKNSRS